MNSTSSLRRYAAAALLAGSLISLAACAGEDAAGVATAGGTASQPADDAGAPVDDGGVAFAECMRGEGIDMPDPVGENGLMEAMQTVRSEYGREELQAGMEACQDQLPDGFMDRGNGGNGPDTETQLEIAECLRDQGLDVPDDLFSGGGMPEGIDRGELMEAMQECRGVMQ